MVDKITKTSNKNRHIIIFIVKFLSQYSKHKSKRNSKSSFTLKTNNLQNHGRINNFKLALERCRNLKRNPDCLLVEKLHQRIYQTYDRNI